MLAARRGLWPLFGASLKMFYRSVDTVLFSVVSPLLLLAGFGSRTGLRLRGRLGQDRLLQLLGDRLCRIHRRPLRPGRVVGAAAGYRASGVLKRIAVTPIPPSTFIAAQVLARVLAGVLATLGILALGARIEYTANLIWVVPLAAIAVLTGVGFAFAIAGAMRTPAGAN
jgi:hypothetical protein